MASLKGLILSGGKGTRLRPLTYTGAKQLVPVANKPVLFYAIEDLVEAGVTDIGIVVGDTREQVMAAVGDGSRFGARVTYIYQEQPLGLAHAVLVSEPFLGDSPFVMFLGDNFLLEGITQYVEEFRKGQADALVLLHRVPNPTEFGVAELVDGRLVRLVERPKEPPSDLVIIGIYMFNHHIFEAAHRIKPSWRGELEITDAIQYLIDRGYRVDHRVINGYWIDTGKKDDLLDANRVVLETLEPRVEGFVDGQSRLYGKVIVEKDAQIINSVIRGPAIIGERTRVVNAYIGPFTSIYHDCVVERAEVEHSIILEFSRIQDLEHRVADSLIGRYVEITRSPMKPRAYNLMLGDHSRVGVV